MSTHLHDLHLAAEPPPGPRSFFDHPARVAIAIAAGVLLGAAVMVATDWEPKRGAPRGDGVDVYVVP